MKVLNDWREQIDRVDRSLVELLNQRAGAVLALAPLKRQYGRPIREPDREREVLANIRGANRGPLSSAALERVFEAVMDEMRAIQNSEDG